MRGLAENARAWCSSPTRPCSRAKASWCPFLGRPAWTTPAPAKMAIAGRLDDCVRFLHSGRAQASPRVRGVDSGRPVCRGRERRGDADPAHERRDLAPHRRPSRALALDARPLERDGRRPTQWCVKRSSSASTGSGTTSWPSRRTRRCSTASAAKAASPSPRPRNVATLLEATGVFKQVVAWNRGDAAAHRRLARGRIPPRGHPPELVPRRGGDVRRRHRGALGLSDRLARLPAHAPGGARREAAATSSTTTRPSSPRSTPRASSTTSRPSSSRRRSASAAAGACSASACISTVPSSASMPAVCTAAPSTGATRRYVDVIKRLRSDGFDVVLLTSPRRARTGRAHRHDLQRRADGRPRRRRAGAGRRDLAMRGRDHERQRTAARRHRPGRAVGVDLRPDRSGAHRDPRRHARRPPHARLPALLPARMPARTSPLHGRRLGRRGLQRRGGDVRRDRAAGRGDRGTARARAP